MYITDDNPRNEEPKKIRDELARYLPRDKAIIEIERWLLTKQFKMLTFMK